MSILHLIGTVHTDPYLSRRLNKAFAIEKPDILTVETDLDSLDCLINIRKKDFDKFFKLLEQKQVSEAKISFFKKYILNPVSEYDVCKSYSEKNNVPFYCIDKLTNPEQLAEKHSSQTLASIAKLSASDFEKVTAKSLYNKVISDYTSHQKFYEGIVSENLAQEFIDFSREQFQLGKRDRVEAEKLIALVSDNPDAKIVHVGGATHNLVDSKGETLYSLLAHLNPTRKTAWAYDER